LCRTVQSPPLQMQTRFGYVQYKKKKATVFKVLLEEYLEV